MDSYKQSRQSAVLLDVDGTLVDSNYLHVVAWHRAFHEIGKSADTWRIHRCIGMGSEQLITSLLGTLPKDLIDKVKQFHADYYEQDSPLLRSFSGARELLFALADQGIENILVTSAAEDEVKRLRKILDSEEVIAFATSAQDVENAKPEPDIIQTALAKAEVPVEQTIFVGDALWDVLAANKVGMPTIGVLTGGTSAAELREAGASAVYENVSELLEELHTSPIAKLLTPR